MEQEREQENMEDFFWHVMMMKMKNFSPFVRSVLSRHGIVSFVVALLPNLRSFICFILHQSGFFRSSTAIEMGAMIDLISLILKQRHCFLKTYPIQARLIATIP